MYLSVCQLVCHKKAETMLVIFAARRPPCITSTDLFFDKNLFHKKHFRDFLSVHIIAHYNGNFLRINLEEQKQFETICTPTANPNRMSAIKISIPTD